MPAINTQSKWTPKKNDTTRKTKISEKKDNILNVPSDLMSWDSRDK